LNDEMEIDQLRSVSSPEHDLNPVLGNDSPTQTIRDGLVSTSGGVSSGLFTDLDPKNGLPPNALSAS
jgi:hypothetical protein